MAPEQVVLDTDKVYVDDRALIGWHRLPAPLRNQLIEALGSLVGQPRESWPVPAAGEIKRWWPDKDVYAYPVMVQGDKLWVFFYEREGRIHIDSLTSQETIDYHTRKKP